MEHAKLIGKEFSTAKEFEKRAVLRDKTMTSLRRIDHIVSFLILAISVAVALFILIN